jgi:ribosomal protein L11 methyltransferase
LDWIEISVAADAEAVDAVAEVLRPWGRGVAIEEPFVQPRVDEEPQYDAERRAVVKTYILDDDAAPETCRRIEEALWHLGQLRAIEPIATHKVAEEDWANAWKPYFPVLRVGDSTVIVPAWRRYRRRPNDRVVRLDPGMAFGTGMHPTTRLCLSAVEEVVVSGCRVLDLGTGSGILAIAAARQGASEVLALDVDPLAVEAARRNVRLNRLGRVVKVSEGTVSMEGKQSGKLGEFDAIFANITAQILTTLARPLATVLAPRGRLAASGILEDRLDVVEGAFGDAGLRIAERRQEGDWVAVMAAREP